MGRLSGIFLPYGMVLACFIAPGIRASSFNASVPGQAIFGSPTAVGVVGVDSAAFAGNGLVGARALSGAAATGALTSSLNQSFAGASSSVDDLVVTGPLPLVVLVNGFRIPFSGIFGYEVDLLSDSLGDVFNGAATADIVLNVFVTCGPQVLSNCGFGYTGSAEVIMTSGMAPTVRATATTPNIQLVDYRTTPITATFIGQAFAGVHLSLIDGISGVFDTGPITLPTGVPFRIDMFVQGSVTATSNGIAGAVSFFDLSHTLGFPQGVPVFDLPPGFTANSAAMGLVNNVTGTPAVPEPGSFGLAASACALIGSCVVLRRRFGRGAV